MANSITVTGDSMPGPSNDRNAAWSIPPPGATLTPPTPTTGQIWPRGQGA